MTSRLELHPGATYSLTMTIASDMLTVGWMTIASAGGAKHMDVLEVDGLVDDLDDRRCRHRA
jgi:hypothetical protein